MRSWIDAIPREVLPAISDAWHDNDGYWVILRDGWRIDNYRREYSIHEDTLAEITAVAKNIVKDKR